MDDKKKELQADVTKGPKFKARVRVSFGHVRPNVEPGEVFQLNDPDLAKVLLDNGSITKDLDFEELPNTAGGTNAGVPSKELGAAPGEVRTAAEQRGDAADAAQGKKGAHADDDDADKGKGKGASK